MATTLKEAALHYQEMGLRIFPLIPLSKRPMAVDSEGYRAMMNAKERCLTIEEVERLWSLYPDANIGEFPGRGSGDSVLDIDKKMARMASPRLRRLGWTLLRTLVLGSTRPGGDSTLGLNTPRCCPEVASGTPLGLNPSITPNVMCSCHLQNWKWERSG